MIKMVSNGYFRGTDGQVHNSINILLDDSVIGFYNSETDKVQWANQGKEKFIQAVSSGGAREIRAS